MFNNALKVNKKMDKTIIMVEYGSLKKIAKVFKVSVPMVSMSLRGHRMGELAKKIRHVALTQYGGVEMEPVNKTKQ